MITWAERADETLLNTLQQTQLSLAQERGRRREAEGTCAALAISLICALAFGGFGWWLALGL
jgi:hypothetical protein